VLLIFLVLFVIQILSEVRFSVIAELAIITNFAHNLCVSSIPTQSIFQNEIAALVCAQNFSSEQERSLYAASGLIHLFVVSGSHFIFLESLLYKLSGQNYKFKKSILFLLLIYGFMCKLSPPVCRSLIALSIHQFLYSMNISWKTHYLILIAGLFCLVLNPNWASSISLQLSWIAGLCISAVEKSNKPGEILRRQILIFLLMFPTISIFQNPTFLGVLSNIFLAPLLEILLFPTALLVCIFNFLYPIFDCMMVCFRTVLIALEFKSVSNMNSIPLFLIYINWALIFIIHYFFHIHHAVKKIYFFRNGSKT
jgi:ComEC/Rec2-related protein